MILLIILFVLLCLGLYIGYRFHQFDKEMDDIFKDCFNQKTDNNEKE